jgi:hypothetical protein
MTPIRLRPIAERDALLAEHLATVEYVDPITSEPWVPEDVADVGGEEDE